MRVLFVNHKCGYFGGVEQYIADAAKGLRGRGHACHLAYGHRSDTGGSEGYPELFESAVECAELSEAGGGEPFGEIIEAVRPDAVYLHKLDNVRDLARHLEGVRTVRVVHDHDLCCPTGYKYYRVSGRRCTHKADWRCWVDLAWIERDRSAPLGVRYASIGAKLDELRANHCIDRFLVLSRFMRDELVQSGFPGGKVSVCPPIVRFGPRPFEPPPTEPRVLYVGQLIRGKGVDFLLRALKQLDTAVRLTIVGEGNARDTLEALAEKLGIAGQCDFRGWVAPDELGGVYAASTVVVVPSRWPEPYGMVGLEAMHHGRPVVAFDVGGIRDWLRHEETGLLVAEADVDGLAAAITRLLEDHKLAATLGKKGAEVVETTYSFDAFLDDLERHLAGSAAG